MMRKAPSIEEEEEDETKQQRRDVHLIVHLIGVDQCIVIIMIVDHL